MKMNRDVVEVVLMKGNGNGKTGRQGQTCSGGKTQAIGWKAQKLTLYLGVGEVGWLWVWLGIGEVG